MDHFNYKNNHLFVEDVAIEDIVKQVKPPFYLYSQATLINHFNILNDSIDIDNKLICFAAKSNTNLSVLKILSSLGSGVDVVSMGEIYKALIAGIEANKIVFSGVGKTDEEIIYALESGIMQFNCESVEEIYNIDKVAKNLNKIANIAIRINPDVDANTHDKISTGKKGNKFGIDIDMAPSVIDVALSLKNINFVGIAVHIGSQITSLEPFKKAFAITVDFIKNIEKTRNIELKTIDFGGGIGVDYGNNDIINVSDYGDLIKNLLSQLNNFHNKKIIFEPGRFISANAGIIVGSVISLKHTNHKNFAIVDVAMNDLLRPCLYDAQHELIPVYKNLSNEDSTLYDFVGPVCESSDIIGNKIKFNNLKKNDLFAIKSCGAYGAVMSSEYNSRPLIAEILVSGDKFEVIRKKPTLDQMISLESIAGWL